MHEPLKNRSSQGKTFFDFMGTDFLLPESGNRCEKQPVLGLDDIIKCLIIEQEIHFTQ